MKRKFPLNHMPSDVILKAPIRIAKTHLTTCECARASLAFTLVEIMVVVCIILVMAALLIPVVKSGMAGARSTQCLSQLHQLGVIFGMFESDHNAFPPHAFSSVSDPADMQGLSGQNWDQGGTGLDVYVAGKDRTVNITHLTICPNARTENVTMNSLMSVSGYAYYCNYNIMVDTSTPELNINAINGRSRNSLVMLMDVNTNKANNNGGGVTNAASCATYAGTSHLGRMSVLWADGHVSQLLYTNLYDGNFKYTVPAPAQ